MSRSKRFRRKALLKEQERPEPAAVATVPEAAPQPGEAHQQDNGSRPLPEASPIHQAGQAEISQEQATPPSAPPPLPAAIPLTFPKQEPPPNKNGLSVEVPPTQAALEERIHKLEAIIAKLQDTRELEERVAQRLNIQVEQERSRQSAAALAVVGKHVLPVATQLMQSSVIVADKTGAKLRMPWLFWEFYQDGRTMIRMLFDKRYRLSWTACLVPLMVLLLMLFSWFTIGAIPVVGGIMDKLVFLVLAFLLYKVLLRETERYRQTVG